MSRNFQRMQRRGTWLVLWGVAACTHSGARWRDHSHPLQLRYFLRPRRGIAMRRVVLICLASLGSLCVESSAIEIGRLMLVDKGNMPIFSLLHCTRVHAHYSSTLILPVIQADALISRLSRVSNRTCEPSAVDD